MEVRNTLGQLGDLTKRVFIGKDKQLVDGAKVKQQKLQIWVERGGKEKLIDFLCYSTPFESRLDILR